MSSALLVGAVVLFAAVVLVALLGPRGAPAEGEAPGEAPSPRTRLGAGRWRTVGS